MKIIKLFLKLIMVSSLFFSCKKGSNIIKPAPQSSITVVNGVINSDPIIMDYYNTHPISIFYNTAKEISFGASQEFSITSGEIPLAIYQLSDTVNTLLKKSFNITKGSIYSLFLAGTDPANPDYIFNQDHPPYHSIADSVIGIRFVNLSPNSNPVSINLQGSPNGSSVSSLAYKAITDFKDYPYKSSVSQYVFEIRDATSGDLLTTYTYNLVPYQNITICVIGQEGALATVPISAVQENNF